LDRRGGWVTGVIGGRPPRWRRRWRTEGVDAVVVAAADEVGRQAGGRRRGREVDPAAVTRGHVAVDVQRGDGDRERAPRHGAGGAADAEVGGRSGRDEDAGLATQERGSAVSRTVRDWVPAILRVAVKVCTPASAAVKV